MLPLRDNKTKQKKKEKRKKGSPKFTNFGYSKPILKDSFALTR